LKSLEYINYSKYDKIIFKHNNGTDLKLEAYLDASYASHADKKSHSGKVIL
jgi:hypothetical protein